MNILMIKEDLVIGAPLKHGDEFSTGDEKWFWQVELESNLLTPSPSADGSRGKTIQK